MDEPVIYGNDVFQHLVLVQTADWTGTPGHSTLTGAPWGTDWSWLPSGGERLHLVVLNALYEVTDDLWLAMNLHLLLGVVVTAVLAFLVLRRFGARDLFAGAAGVLIAATQSFYAHLGLGHLFLLALYPLVLGVYLAVWATTPQEVGDAGPGGTRSARALVVPAVAATVIGMSSTYYAVFSVVVILGLGVAVAVRRGSWRALARPVGAGAVVVGVFLLSSLPTLLSGHAAVVERPLSDVDSYAMRAAQVLLPQPYHPVKPLAELGGLAKQVNAPSEDGSAIGLLATAGLVIAVVVAIRRIGRPRDEADGVTIRLAAIAGVSFAMATVGGGGFLLAVGGATEVRVWSRMASMTAVCGLAALALAATRLTDSRGRGTSSALLVGLTVTMVGVGLTDQRIALRSEEGRAELVEDRGMRRDLATALAGDTTPMVYQVPAASFPDDLGSYRLLAASLEPIDAEGTEQALEFSGGTFSGGPGDWQQSWAIEDAGTQVLVAASAGFDVMLVELTNRNLPEPDAFVSDVRELLGEPIGRSTSGTWEWYDLRALREDLVEDHGADEVDQLGAATLTPIGIDLRGTTGYERDVTFGPEGDITLRRHSGGESADAVILEGRVGAAAGSEVVLRWPGGSRTLSPGPDGEEVTIEVPLSGDETVVDLRVEGRPMDEERHVEPVYARWDSLQVRDRDAVDLLARWRGGS
jgi:hypothetical protein